MRTLSQTLVLAAVLLVLVGCQPVNEPTAEPSTEAPEEAATCLATLTDFVADSGILDVSTMTVEDVDTATIPGSLEAQVITQHDEVFVVSRFQMPETASALMMSLSNENVFGEDTLVLDESPVSLGDETRWIEFDQEPPMQGAMVQYGDRIVMAKAGDEAVVSGIIESFEGAMLDYIDDHPECAYLHPETR